MKPENYDELIALLPWYVNDTLDAEEKQQVQALLDSSAEAREELEMLTRLSEGVKADHMDFEGAELGWRRLQKTISAQPEKQAPSSGWLRPLLATAAVLVICVQFGINLQQQQTISEKTQLLSGAIIVNQADSLLVQVQMADKASWQQLQDTVLALDANIIQGPTAMGLISIQIPVATVQRYDNTESLLTWLKAQPGVDYVQPVVSE